MSRAGYSDDYDEQWQIPLWRGAVRSAMRGKRGQAFLREMLAALDALPQHRLTTRALERDGEVCALGAVGKLRGVPLPPPDPDDYDDEFGYEHAGEAMAGMFGIAEAMAREIMYQNDEGNWNPETPEQRWTRMRLWVEARIASKGEEE